MTRRRRPLDLPVDEDVRRELAFHLEMRARELEEEGLSPEEARREAARAFGNYERVVAACRELSENSPRDSIQMFESILQDVKFAWRSLARSPGFVIIAIVTLALGIGANTAIFTVVHAALLSPLPYPDADRIVTVWEGREDGVSTYVSPRNFLDWKDGVAGFAALALYPSQAFSAPTTVLGGELPARAWITPVTAGFFDAMGVEPALGREFTAREWQPGAPAVAMVSHDFWRTILGGESDLSAIELRAFGTAAPVVGVMPEGFGYPGATDIWLPADAGAMSSSRTSHGYEVVGRLREGVSIDEIRTQLEGVHRFILATDAEDDQHPLVRVRSLREQLYGEARAPLLLLLGAAGLVLLVACTNLGSALLARGAGRRRELAIRSSLGAHRSRLVRQLLTETLLLGAVGAAAGLVTGRLALAGLVRLDPAGVPRAEGLVMDATVLAFTVALALLTTLLFGLLPSLRLARSGAAGALRAGGRGSAGDHRARVWSWLVGAEVALAIVLLVGSGLLVRSLQEVLGNDPGFEVGGVLTAEISLPSDLYPTHPDVVPPMQRILAELETLPGVRAVGAVNNLPLGGSSLNGSFRIAGRPAEEGGYGDYRVATAGYFQAMGIPLVRGRGFTVEDHADAPHVALINRTAAERYWPGDDPIGQRIGALANDSWVYSQEATIVGVVGDVRHRGLTADPAPEVYVHYLQRPMRLRSSTLTIHTDDDAAALVAAVRERVASVDDQIPLEFATMTEHLARSVNDRRFVLTVIGTFSLVALVLAVVGIYGVVSYSTARRTREIGIRMALGAAPRAVRRLVVRESLRVVLTGAGVGLAASLAAARLLDTLLYEVSPADPATFGLAAGVLVAAAWLASAVPAWRGSRVDPMATMRSD